MLLGEFTCIRNFEGVGFLGALGYAVEGFRGRGILVFGERGLWLW